MVAVLSAFYCRPTNPPPIFKIEKRQRLGTRLTQGLLIVLDAVEQSHQYSAPQAISQLGKLPLANIRWNHLQSNLG